MVTIVLLKDAWMWAIPCGTCFRSFFLKVFFLPFLSGAAAPVPAAAGAAGFAIVSRSSLVVVFGRSSLVVGLWSLVVYCCRRQLKPMTNDYRPTTDFKFSL